jgi:hypothetical protein
MDSETLLRLVDKQIYYLSDVLLTNLRDYFTCCELDGLEREALERHWEKTVHAFMVWLFEDPDERFPDLACLQAIERTPLLNHLHALYDLYCAAVEGHDPFKEQDCL